MIISTVSFKRRLYRLVGCVLTIFILAMAATAVYADKPPDALFKHVTSTSQLMHQGLCDVKSLGKTDTLCLIYFDEPNKIVWVVLFDQDKNGQPAVTHVMVVKEQKETIAWCRNTVCL